MEELAAWAKENKSSCLLLFGAAASAALLATTAMRSQPIADTPSSIPETTVTPPTQRNSLADTDDLVDDDFERFALMIRLRFFHRDVARQKRGRVLSWGLFVDVFVDTRPRVGFYALYFLLGFVLFCFFLLVAVAFASSRCFS